MTDVDPSWQKRIIQTCIQSLRNVANQRKDSRLSQMTFYQFFCEHSLSLPGVVLMDLNGEDLVTIVNRVVDKMVIADQLSAENKGSVIKTLLLKHR